MTATPPANLAKTLLELFLVVLAVGLLDLSSNLSDTLVDVSSLAAAFDDRRVALVDRDLLGTTELLERDVLKLNTQVFADQRAAGQGRDVAQHRLATIAETRSLHGTHVQACHAAC